jgi:hypothetical protein
LVGGDDLTIVLFFVGTAVSFGCAAMSAAGWRHPLLIISLFALAAFCFAFGAGWPAIKGISPPSLANPVREIATNPVSWFVILVLGMIASILMPRRQRELSPRPIASSPSPSALMPSSSEKKDDSEKQLPLPYQERVFVNVTPAHLVGLFRSRTSIQAKALIAPHIGKWISVTAPVSNVGGDIDRLWVTLNDGGTLVSARCSKPESERAIHFTNDAVVTVQGRIEEVDRISVLSVEGTFS